jgi:hypothetical protein
MLEIFASDSTSKIKISTNRLNTIKTAIVKSELDEFGLNKISDPKIPSHTTLDKDSFIRSLSAYIEYINAGFVAGGAVSAAIHGEDNFGDIDIYFNVQLKDEYYVGTVHLPIKSFDIVN